MPFQLSHILAKDSFTPERHSTADGIHFTVESDGSFDVLHTGSLTRIAEASYRHLSKVPVPDTEVPDIPGGIDDPGGLGGPGGGPGGLGGGPGGVPDPTGGKGFTINEISIPCTLTIRDPDGRPFAANTITRADLDRYRDRRGLPRGRWTYSLRGRSTPQRINESLGDSLFEEQARLEVSILETVRSQSAPPLIPRTPIIAARDFTFDLYREGVFEARIDGVLMLQQWSGTMTLRNPDGLAIATSTRRVLTADIPLASLGASRDASGAPRNWTLSVAPRGLIVGSPRVTATVVGRGRVAPAVLRDRIESLLGPGGEFIQLVGRNTATDVEARMTITDEIAAETIDMHGLLDGPLKKIGASTDIQAGRTFTLFRKPRDVGHGITLDVSDIRLTGLSVTVGRGGLLGSDTPAAILTLQSSGRVRVEWHGKTVATAAPNGGSVTIEIGIRLDPDGTSRMVSAVGDKPFDIDLDAVAIAAVIVLLGGVVGGITAAVVDELIEDGINGSFADSVADLVDDQTLAPRILMVILGAHLEHRRIAFDGDDILFEHIAPLEPDRKPRSTWKQAIGRSWQQLGPGITRFQPATLGDTWKADNLNEKIDHIVVVMMENRSYDHVLGYRTLPGSPGSTEGANGLTDDIIQALEGTVDGFTVRRLRDARFPLNLAGKRTRLPHGVGHEVEDVAEQLERQVTTPGGRTINGPQGFVNNFRRNNRLSNNPTTPEPTLPEDVLGFYDEQDLPVYAFLAEHYAYADRYYCSHPGPTLPNRMYQLTGDVDHDRFGFPILHNHEGDTFLLSRQQTVYDALEKAGVSWRVYESAPSVTMLRLFARYATDNVRIRPLDRLEADIAAGDLPSFTSIEPAMHHHPQDDDHPDADMWRGQHFIWRVVKALRSNPAIWRRTLLIITYDEHGGLYDHAVPPVAEVLVDAPPDTVNPGSGSTPGAGTVATPGAGTVAGGSGAVAGGRTGGGRRGGLLEPDRVSLDDLVIAPDDDAPAPQPVETLIRYGLRVPTFVVSPWVAAGKGPSIVLDHCSVTKTVLARFAQERKPFLSERVAASQTFESFLTATEPRLDIPLPEEPEELPTSVRSLSWPGASLIETPPLTRRRMREEGVDYQDLSGWVARMLLGR